MRILFAIIVLAGLAWCGWWWFNAAARERALEDWLAERRADGWVAEAQVSVRGFPNRVDALVTDLELADPESGWAWTAPEFQILSLTYQPHHFVAIWPGPQTVATPFETIRIASDRLRGSLVFEPNLRLALDRSTIEMTHVTLNGDAGWDAAIGQALLSTRQGDSDHSHDVSFQARDWRLPAAWTSRIDRAGLLPPAIDSADLDMTLGFDRPWDRAAIEGESPEILAVEIRDARFAWGDLDLRAQGRLAADSEGMAAGRLNIRARNWRTMLDIAEDAGAVGPGLAGALRTGLDLLARLGGDRNTLNAPLDFEGGRVRLGPIPIGPAPRLVQRQ